MLEGIGEGQLYPEPPHSPSLLTLNRAATLFAQAWRFHGWLGANTQIIDWLHYKHPMWKIDTSMRRQLTGTAQSAIIRDCHPDRFGVAEPQIFDRTLTSGLDYMERTFNGVPRDEDVNPIMDIARDVVMRDSVTVEIPADSEQVMSTVGTGFGLEAENEAAQASAFCYFGLEGKTTGNADMDELFGDMVGVARKFAAGENINMAWGVRVSFLEDLTTLIPAYYQRFRGGEMSNWVDEMVIDLQGQLVQEQKWGAVKSLVSALRSILRAKRSPPHKPR